MWKATKKKLKHNWRSWHRHANTIAVGVAFLIASLVGCRESLPPALQLSEETQFTDTTYITEAPTPQPRTVLIEEFTGVQCANCVSGHEALRNIVEAYGERVVVVSYHTGVFATPLPESKYDFRTPDATQITQAIGSPPGYPVAVIDRRDFDGDGSLMELNSAEWMMLVSALLDSPTLANIDLTAMWTASDTLLVKVEAHFLQNLTWEVFISVAVVQDSITDAQLTPSGTDTSYMHRWVFREMVTAVGGDLLFSAPERGRFVRRIYRVPATAIFLSAPPARKKVCAWLHLFGASMAERWVLNATCTSLP